MTLLRLILLVVLLVLPGRDSIGSDDIGGIHQHREWAAEINVYAVTWHARTSLEDPRAEFINNCRKYEMNITRKAALIITTFHSTFTHAHQQLPNYLQIRTNFYFVSI